MGEIRLIKIQHPFNRQKRTEEMVDYNHETLQVIRDAYFPKELGVIVSVNGGVVSKENLPLVTLKHGDEVVFYPEIEGGGDIFRTVAMLALVAVAIVLAVPSGGTSIFGTASLYAAGAVGTGMATAIGMGTMFVGGLLINALLPASVPDTGSYSAISSDSFNNSNTFSWQPVTKQQQGLVLPKFYGTIPVYGNIISTYTENIENKNYINVLLHVGQGPINRLYDYYINDQPVENLTGVNVVTKYGLINQSVITNFNDTKTEYTANIACTYNTPYTYETTGSAFDGLEVDITFPRGLYYANDRGGLDATSVDIQVLIKKQGDSTWTAISKQAVSIAYTTTDSYWSYGYWIGGIWYEYPQFPGEDSGPSDHIEGERAENYWVPGNFIWHWVTTTGTAYADSTIDYVTVTGRQNSAIIKTFKSETNLPHGKYDIKVTRLSADYTGSRYGATSYLTGVREVFKDDFTYPRSALVGIKALATDQLSGSFKFKCMMEASLIRYYDGSNWHVGFNNNPAWVCYDVLTQPLFDDPDEVAGSDGFNYRCIADHTSSADNKPITGGDYALYWQQGGENGTVGDNIITGGTASADSVHSTVYEADKACDNNLTTYWLSKNTAFPHWWKYDFGITKIVSKLRIYKYYDTSGQALKDFTLQGSNDDAAWDIIYTGTAADATANEWEEWNFANVTGYRYYKVNVTSNYRTDTYVMFYEVQMFETGLKTMWELSTDYKTWSATALRYDGIDPTRLDTTTFKEWADWCDELILSGKESTDLISTASEVIGTDGLNYSCILNHTAADANKPITGANYLTYWSQTGTAGGPWQTGKDYNSNVRKATSATTTTLTDNTKSWYYNTHIDKVVEITAGTGSGQRRLITGNTKDTLTVYPVWTTPLSTDSEYSIREDYERNFAFNGGFDSGTTLWDAVLQIALMSRALLVWDGTTIKVIIDRAVTLPDDVSQLFSTSNIYVNSFEETFLSSSERTGEIEINFVNKDIGYEKDSLIVLNTTLDKPENRNTISLLGTTSSSQAWRMGYFFLAQNELLKRTIKFDADVDAITCMVGDVIYFQHDVPQWGVCGGRVAASSQVLGGTDGLNYTCKLNHTSTANDRPGMVPATANWATYWTQTGDAGSTWVTGTAYVTSSTATTISIDQSVTLSGSPTTYSIMVWLSNDTLLVKTVDNSSPGATTTLTITDTWGSANPEEYDKFAFGESDNTAKAFRVIEVSRTSDLKCTIRAVEYDANVYSVDSGTPILSSTTYTAREAIAIVTNLAAVEEAKLDDLSGISKRYIHVTWDKPVNVYYDHAEVWYSSTLTNQYIYAGRSYNNDFYIPDIVANTDYVIRVISVSYVGVKTSEFESPLIAITTNRVLKINDYSVIGSTLQQRVNGLQLNQLSNGTEFDGKDCIITWNALSPTGAGGAGEESTGAGASTTKFWLKDYEVRVYTTTGTLRRIEYTGVPIYTYSFEENSKDGSGAVSSFTFEVRARDITGNTSKVPAILSVSKALPSNVTGTTATSIVGGVKFDWDKSTDVAWNLYTYRITVNSVTGSWTDTEVNTVTKLLSSTEVAALITANTSPETTIGIEVKQKDVYGQESATEDKADTIANAVAANLFQIIGLTSSEGVTGDIADLYNGTLGSGGVVIT